MLRKLILSCLILIGVTASGQDIHFSQYYASPLTLNPALTGNINGLFRAFAIYRNQWFSITPRGTAPTYVTYQGSFDMALMRERLDKDGFGIGLNIYSDKAGEGALITQSALASIAYHKALDRYGKTRLSFALQGGVITKRISIHELIFEDQLSGLDFNTNFGSYDHLNANNTQSIRPDANIGVLYTSAANDQFKYYFGGSIFHVAQPFESLLNTTTTNRLDRRYSVNVGAEISFNEYFKMMPSSLFMLQSNARQWNIGTAFEYESTDELAFIFGGYYRVQDAAILMVGAEFNDIRMGVSYDVNASELTPATRANGGVEISVQYIFGKLDRRFHYERYCPSF